MVAEVEQAEQVDGVEEILTQQQIDALASKNASALGVTMPPEMRARIELRAEQEGVKPAAWARAALAAAIGFELPAETTARVKKYASEEEQKAAAAKLATAKRNAVNDMLKRIKGDLKFNA